MKITQIKETCIYTEDLEQIRPFYETKLKLPLISYVPGRHIFYRAGSSVLLFFNPSDSATKSSPPGHYGSGKQHFAFEVMSEDYEEARAEIIASGIAITDEIVWGGGGRSFYFNDPAGNVLEVVQSRGLWE